ncbi:MAG TPA: GNAT family N-acetyltransferase [Thermoanaerobaculia bacterium]|nr:GNAT family N-acetyltransferase [Thermoanaerobaculia bacterium]
MDLRTATLDDSPAFAGLLDQLGYPGVSADDARRRLVQLLDRADHAVFVAADDAVAGFIHVCVAESLEHEPRAEIRSLVVGEKQQSGGIGASLVAAAEAWARSLGLRGVRVRSNVIRERARRFYERLGYNVTKAQNVFDKSL